MSRTSTLLLAVTALGSAAGLACQHLPDDWQQRDLEGKWAYYKNDSQNSRDPNCAKNWALLLANNKEFELLEWIALFEGWRHPGPHLVKHRAPQMYRAALWNLGGWDSSGSRLGAAICEKAAGCLPAICGLGLAQDTDPRLL